MKRLNTQKGFTLVELAIVMTIIGLLIGGILKGQELMQNARITASVSQVKSYSAAVTTFKDMYQATPGDMLNAGTRLVGCPGTAGAACNPLAASAGDNIVGLSTWSAAWGAPGIVTTSGTTAPSNVDAERYLFWSHLLLANLIGGINADGLSTATGFAFGATNPEAKIGGGFVVGYDTGVIGPGAAGLQTAGTGLSGTILVQASNPTGSLATMAATSGLMPLAPLRAAQLDRKMDDGRPATGYVQAWGVGASCFDTAATLVYNETISLTDCGLMYRIEN
jgi:prepilin-type N-terminal cleavage/methylation domain-containing protein